VPDSTKWAELDAALGTAGIVELVDWRVGEVLRGKTGATESNAEQKTVTGYSLLLRVTFQAPDRTLREDELQGFSQQVIDAVAPLGARLRS
jgi:phenylalanyl-tRNA synthetase beta chain